MSSRHTIASAMSHASNNVLFIFNSILCIQNIWNFFLLMVDFYLSQQQTHAAIPAMEGCWSRGWNIMCNSILLVESLTGTLMNAFSARVWKRIAYVSVAPGLVGLKPGFEFNLDPSLVIWDCAKNLFNSLRWCTALNWISEFILNILPCGI